MKYPTLATLLLLILDVDASRGGVKGLRGLKGDKQKGNGKREGGKQPTEKSDKNEQEQDRTFRTNTETQEQLFSCLSSNLEGNPEVSANSLVTCTDSLESVVVSTQRRRKWDSTEELSELLRCVGESVGCQEEQQGGTTNVVQGEEYFDCLSDVLQGEEASTDASNNPMDCVSLWEQPLQDLLTCIGDSVGCELVLEDPEGEDRNDAPPVRPIPIPLPEGWDQVPPPQQDVPGLVFPNPLPEGEDRFDDPPLVPIPIPLPESQQDEPGLVPLPEGEDRLDDAPMVPIPIPLPETGDREDGNGSDIIPLTQQEEEEEESNSVGSQVMDLLDHTGTLGYLYDNLGFP